MGGLEIQGLRALGVKGFRGLGVFGSPMFTRSPVYTHLQPPRKAYCVQTQSPNSHLGISPN